MSHLKKRNGYFVTVHHEDGTSTYREVSPEDVTEQMRQREQYKQSAFQQPHNLPELPEFNTWMSLP
jgi:hypothetical protein